MPRNSEAEDLTLCFDLVDSQFLYRVIEEDSILKEKIVVLEKGIAKLEKENELLRKGNEYQEKLTELSQREVELYRRAFELEVQLTDRALKLGESQKSKWGILGIIGGIVAAFVIGLAIGL